MTYTTLQYWRRRFREEAGELPRPRGRPSSAAERWAPVRVVPDASPKTESVVTIDVWLSNGIGLEIPAGFDGDELRRLVGVLSSC